MDAVITYVNGLDPVWQASYSKAAGVPALAKRFRDWGTLKYLLRGIENCMPFIDDVFLVVASGSQVPDWADTDHLRVMLHEQIMPSGLLPVFNSCTIEMFLHRIPGLDEEFIYFNDDMFPLGLSCRTDFFEGGKGKIGISHELFAMNMYKKQCKTSDALARKALGLRPGLGYVRPQHICSPMLVSASKKAFSAVEPDIMATASTLRKPENPNQYFFLDYMFHSGLLCAERISNKHLSQGVNGAEQLADYIINPRTKMACINDVEMPDEKYREMRRAMITAFETRFPERSRYEKTL